MRSLTFAFVAVSMLSLCTASAQETSTVSSLGVRVEIISASAARQLTGIEEPGLAIREVSPNSFAEELGLRLRDVITSINGETARQPRQLESLSRSSKLTLAVCRSNARLTITREPQDGGAKTKVFFLGPGTSELVEILQEGGFDVKTGLALPPQLGDTRVVVLAYNKAWTEATFKRLKSFMAKGGGVVLSGMDTFGKFGMIDWANTTSESEWLGTDQVDGHNSNFFPPDLTVKNRRPLGTDLSRGTVVFTFEGHQSWPGVETGRLNSLAEPMLVWQNEDERRGFVGAYTFPYGKGMLYFQSICYSPNYPLLGKLFLAGTRHVATERARPEMQRAPTR